MKNRNLFCYALDTLGLIALLASAVFLAGALWAAAGTNEAFLLAAFGNCLVFAIASLAVARIYEIYQVLEADQPAAGEEATVVTANVEALPERKHLPRAA